MGIGIPAEANVVAAPCLKRGWHSFLSGMDENEII
jgi:hypothetical protein